jgi:shikimate kinase
VIPSNTLFLIGMPASGKTHWAEQLSARHNINMLDTDDIIEDEEDCSISELFDKKGEAYFRQREHEVLLNIIAQQQEEGAEPLLVACGGGMPCYNNNMQLMNEGGTTLYLRSSAAVLIERLLAEFEKRPLLSEQQDLQDYARQLLEERKKYYEQADQIIDTENLSLITFEPIIKACIEQP